MFSTWLIGGILLRLAMLIFGVWQDVVSPTLPYTDVDYRVFTDAAYAVAHGMPPYDRSTYRYTPLLAWMMLPNLIFPLFGKLLFVSADIVSGIWMYKILRGVGKDESTATTLAGIWLANPMVANISTRGSAESILAVLVLGTMWLIQQRKFDAAALVFGLAVHFKIYPVIYALPIWILLDERSLFIGKGDGKDGRWWEFFLGKTRWRFGVVALATFIALNVVMYVLYGQIFLDETYLYHVTRKDHRHNFSIWFYPIYLASGDTTMSMGSYLGLLAFLPQLLLVIYLGARYAQDPPMAWFAQTVAFVALNKVCTSQYFMWYICLLPLILPSLRIKFWWHGAFLLATWVITQAAWLNYAFQLEFLGADTFYSLWISGAALLVSHFLCLGEILRNYIHTPWTRPERIKAE